MTEILTFDPDYPLTDKQRNQILIALYDAAVNGTPVVMDESTLAKEVHQIDGSQKTQVTSYGPLIQNTDVSGSSPNGDVVSTTKNGLRVVFHSNATANEVGTVINVEGYFKLTFIILRTGVTANTVSFLAGIDSSNLFPYLADMINSSAVPVLGINSTTLVSEMWEMDVSSKAYVKLPITNLNTGSPNIIINGFLE
jgi:hypothetical protein